MVSAQRRARAKENIRRAILDAARELFATEDYKAVSMRRLAEKIEYSPTAIYLHFKDKEEILFYLIEEGFGMLSERLEAIAVEISDPVERLREGARVYFDFAFSQPHYYRLMFQLEDRALAESLMPRVQGGPRSFQYILDTVGQGLREGKFRRNTDLERDLQRDPQGDFQGDFQGDSDKAFEVEQAVLASVIWSHIHGAVALSLSGHICVKLPEETRGAFYHAVVETTLRGLMV